MNQPRSNSSGKALGEQKSRIRSSHWPLFVGAFACGMSLVSTPTACGTNARISREPIAQVGDNDVSTSTESSGDSSRIEVDPQISNSSPLREETVSGAEPAAIRSDKQLFEPKVAPAFCSGLKAGECLTLVIQVPGSVLQSSLGLGALGLALASPSYNALLHRTCSEGLKVGLPVVEAGLPIIRRNGVAKKLFSPFKRARCVYQVLTEESELPPAPEPNETSLKIRLVDFSLSGSAISTNPVIGRFEFKESRMQNRFHDVSVNVPNGAMAGEWQPVRGGWNLFDTATYSGIFKTSDVNITIARGLTFKVNGFGLAAYMNQVLEPFLNESTQTQSLVKARAQIEMMRMAVRSLRQGKSPVTSSLVLIGMGLDAIKDLCKTPGSDCSVQGKNTDLVSELEVSFDNGQPLQSSSKALLIDALKYVPLGLVRAVFEHSDEKTFVNQMQGLNLN
ncbi:MAG: hypothetical protein RLZZ488_1837 [Pseudomonadota bacterium]|jgi:hypothetical protein